MEGTKIKNIVIIILLLLNGFLLFLVGGRWMEDSHSHDAARGSAIQVIRDGGIALEEADVPREMTLGSMQAQRDLGRENALAARLLGEGMSVEARGGEVYRYSSSWGWLQFHSTGEFLAEFEPGAFLLTQEGAQSHGAELLAKLDFDTQLLEDAVREGEGSITFRQTVDGAPVLGCQATLNYRDGSLVSITGGRRLPGQPHPTGEDSALSVATALMRLYNGLKGLGDIYNRIESITPAYTLSVSLSGPVRLEPVWYVKTDTGAYQLDTRTGQVSRENAFGSAAVEGDMAQ